MGATKKRNHYLPRAYLCGFCDWEGLLWSFDRRTKEYRRLPPNSAAVEKEFYIVKDASGRKSNAVEDWLGQCENAAIPVIRKLESDQPQMTEAERHVLARFISLLRLRTTVFNAEMEEVLDHYARALGDALFSDEHSARQLIAKLPGNGAELPRSASNRGYRCGKPDSARSKYIGSTSFISCSSARTVLPRNSSR